ncbi:hypothetical protein FPOAC1_009631 [Fusarium poae]|uniref:hypothetical protein n=1 Tax=Fusarium poae TaxID=36050 RepID=UPI001CE80340|nr:hypothetical protein FPOAC1_009631 [Fusarium poae]KAG8670226.1 hypothetical protein FPOAC1_009631 [Fusarium poae]
MPSQSNLRAAQAVVLSRQRLRRGLNRDAAGRRKKPLTLRAAEARYAGSARASIGRIVKRLEAANTVDYEDVVDPKMGRPRQLTDEEEEAIVCYIIWMEKSGLPASKWEIEDAALTLRRRRDPDARPVSKMWYSRFRDDHPELAKSILKSREASRAEYEEGGVDDTKEWFQRLSDVMTKYNIGASETWNADEAGVRVGMLRDKMECLVVRTKKKSATEKKLREALRKGNLTFGRRAFAGAFQEIFNEGFTAAHIISGFQKTGIYPPTDRPAIEYLLRKQLKKKKTFTPAHFSLLPSDMRFHAASSTAETIGERYHDILSSPTLAGLRHIRNIVHEAVVLEDVIKISLQDLRDQQEEAIADDKKKQHKQGIRFTRSVIIKEMNRLKDEWRENKEVIVNGIPKRLQFKQWLEHTGKQYDYLSMDTQRSQMTQALKEETDGYMIDTQLPDDVREAIRKAQYAAKPLSAVDLTGLPHSDDTVTFNLTQAHEHEEMDEEDEILPVIEVAGGSEVEMPSSPPCAPDSESSLPTLPSTPCPYQHHTQLHESLRDIIRGIRTAQEDSLIG